MKFNHWKFYVTKHVRFSIINLIYNKNGHRPLPLPRPKENSTIERPCQQIESTFHWVYISSQVRVSLLKIVDSKIIKFPLKNLLSLLLENWGILTQFMPLVAFYSHCKLTNIIAFENTCAYQGVKNVSFSFSDASRGYWKRPVVWNGLIFLNFKK